ncbi:hypothetical protein LIER_20883 [Lithospermum erythrorhizon]|uniref:Uncharacterized protein n=1 Tax=Lithospermum erythrorhizon TaxID=34254 RepID=A0AAV3QN61_LITER
MALKGPFRGKARGNSFRGRRSCGSSQPRSTTNGILAAKPTDASKKDTKCQICGKFNHKAFEYKKRFDHAFSVPQLHHSLAAMQLNEDTSTTWFPDSRATSHMTGNASLLSNLLHFTGSSSVMVGN